MSRCTRIDVAKSATLKLKNGINSTMSSSNNKSVGISFEAIFSNSVFSKEENERPIHFNEKNLETGELIIFENILFLIPCILLLVCMMNRPLIVLCGKPCCGKTTVAMKIADFIKEKGGNVEVINLESVKLDRESTYGCILLFPFYMS